MCDNDLLFIKDLKYEMSEVDYHVVNLVKTL